MKKTISVLFALFFAFSVFVIPVSADEAAEGQNHANISACFHSDIAGLTGEDYDKLADISSGNLEFRVLDGKVRVGIHDCVGTPYNGEFKPGRTYEIDYEFVAAEGYVLPKDFTGDELDFTCDKGCKVYSCRYIDNLPAHVPQIPLLYVTTEVRVDGNLFQRIIGKIADIILEIRAWSLY